MLGTPSVSVEAITTVAGNSTIQNVTNNAQFITNLAGRADVPIFSGADKPLVREQVPAVVHGASGLDGANVTEQVSLDGRAVDELIAHVAAAPGELTLLVFGPQTNIALAIQRAPDVMKQVKEIVMMGGAFTVPGNKNAVAEFNICVDPEAAAIVAAFDVLKRYIPLDVCNDIQVPERSFDSIRSPKIRETLLAMMRPYIENLNSDEIETRGALMYDVLAGFAVLQPSACKVVEARVQVETKGELTYGMTLVDRRLSQRTQKPNARIVTAIDEDEFKRTFFSALDTLA
jgi:purine nucleosidase